MTTVAQIIGVGSPGAGREEIFCSLPGLATRVEELARALCRFGFECPPPLIDPSRDEILTRIGAAASRKMTSYVLCYIGHGGHCRFSEADEELYSFLLCHRTHSSEEFSDLLGDELSRELCRFENTHSIGLIIDCCYPELIVRDGTISAISHVVPWAGRPPTEPGGGTAVGGLAVELDRRFVRLCATTRGREAMYSDGLSAILLEVLGDLLDEGDSPPQLTWQGLAMLLRERQFIARGRERGWLVLSGTGERGFGSGPGLEAAAIERGPVTSFYRDGDRLFVRAGKLHGVAPGQTVELLGPELHEQQDYRPLGRAVVVDPAAGLLLEDRAQLRLGSGALDALPRCGLARLLRSRSPRTWLTELLSRDRAATPGAFAWDARVNEGEDGHARLFVTLELASHSLRLYVHALLASPREVWMLNAATPLGVELGVLCSCHVLGHRRGAARQGFALPPEVLEGGWELVLVAADRPLPLDILVPRWPEAPELELSWSPPDPATRASGRAVSRVPVKRWFVERCALAPTKERPSSSSGCSREEPGRARVELSSGAELANYQLPTYSGRRLSLSCAVAGKSEIAANAEFVALWSAALHRPMRALEIRSVSAASRHAFELDFVRERPFDVLHLVGHGDRRGFLFANDDILGAARLAQLLRSRIDRRAPIRLLYLNSCHSFATAREIRALVPCVIAADGVISDEAARGVARRFYEGLLVKAGGYALAPAFAGAQAEARRWCERGHPCKLRLFLRGAVYE